VKHNNFITEIYKLNYPLTDSIRIKANEQIFQKHIMTYQIIEHAFYTWVTFYWLLLQRF